MLRKILLGKKKNKSSNNVNNKVNVDINSNTVLLPNDGISDTVDAYQEYIKEKNDSQKYRLIFTVNPVCSNILFNAVSEIVFKEGSEECKLITPLFPSKNNAQAIYDTLKYDGKDIGVNEYLEYKSDNGINAYKCIRDTAFSHEDCGGFTYHCGLNIFNNHMLRKNGFIIVNKLNELTKNSEFNSISDYLRDKNGDIIKEKILRKVPDINIDGELDTGETQLHQYQFDTINTFQRTVREKLVESDGWVGFINPSTMKIDNYVTGNTSICLNKCINNNKSGEFIDMYPDRSLYSFIPKYNKYRKREEYNWDYIITYPYDEERLHSIVSESVRNTGVINGLNCKFWGEDKGVSIKSKIAIIASTVGDNYSGSTNYECVFKTDLKNNLVRGASVSFSFISNTTVVNTEAPIRVTNTAYNGYDSLHCFSVNLDDVLPYILKALGVDSTTTTVDNINIDALKIRVRKVVNGGECQYYIRKFKKLPNFNHDVRTTAGNKEDFNSSLNKLAFAENIFSDKVAQIIFNDDIDTTGVFDNKGRQLTELYLTIIKTNRGHDKWYTGGENGINSSIFGDENVEFSHCFGKVDSGLDLAPDIEAYNIHKINNISPVSVLDIDNGSGITKENDFFYGDVVEFSPYTVEETVIENVYHRFNTAQREFYENNTTMSAVTYDEIKSDDYDLTSRVAFYVEKDKLLSINSSEAYTNIAKEGYYYQPHYKIKLREISNEVKQGNHTLVTFMSGSEPSLIENTGETYVYSGTTTIPYYFYEGETIDIYVEQEIYKGKITDVKGFILTEIEFECNNPNLNGCKIFKRNNKMPQGAYELNDGSGRYLWRDILSADEIIYGDELYDSVFTNGAHYFHNNINFYLRRQDPNGEYGLNDSNNFDGFTGASEGKIKDISYAEYIEEGESEIC